MSQSDIYGFSPFELKPGPDFSAGMDDTGKWTGSQTFTCRKYDYSSAIIQNKIVRGTPATSLYPQLTDEWSFLYVLSHRHEHEPGGITKIYIEYAGAAEDSPDPGETTDKEQSFSMSATMTEKDMFTNPYFTPVSEVEKGGIRGLLKGTARLTSDPGVTPIVIADNYSGYTWSISTTEGLEMYDIIITQDKLTYPAPAVEWTIQKTNKAGISDEDLSGLGYIATPEGSPPTFTDRNWMFTGATQTRANANPKTVKTWTKTYTLSPPGEKYHESIFAKPVTP